MDAINSIKSVNVFLMTITLVMGMISFWNVDFLPSAITLGYILIFSYFMPDDNGGKLLEEYRKRVVELTTNVCVDAFAKVFDEWKSKETETVKDEVSEKPKRKKHYHCNRFPKKNKNKKNNKIKHNYTKRNKYSQVK